MPSLLTENPCPVKGMRVPESSRVFRMRQEVTKGERGMPGRQEPKKDVVHCEKGRGAVCGP